MIYYVYSHLNNLVKIGFAQDMRARAASLITDSPVELRLLAAHKGNIDDEATVQQQFTHLKHHGEWYRLESELLKHIAETDEPAAIMAGEWLKRVRGNTWFFHRYLQMLYSQQHVSPEEYLSILPHTLAN